MADSTFFFRRGRKRGGPGRGESRSAAERDRRGCGRDNSRFMAGGAIAGGGTLIENSIDWASKPIVINKQALRRERKTKEGELE
ncbi:hypothetical protein J6590_032595 [Homalodisca vitripennis]|nr:hypothetical protein J6590_032595 [Homalodisca vitripennis]